MPSIRSAIPATLIVVAVGGLAHHLVGDLATEALSGVALLVLLVVAQPLLRIRERLLLTAALALTAICLVRDPSSTDTIRRAMEQATFLAAFIVLLGVLKEAALTSISIRDLGRWVTRQKPSRRYLAIALSSLVLTALLNVGALALLAPLIQSGVLAGREAGDEPWVSKIKERRQMSAALRGFAVVILFAPTSVTQALLSTLFPTSDPTRILLNGMALAAIWIAIGWAEDMVRWGGTVRRLAASGQMPRREPLPVPWRALGDLAVIIVVLAAGVVVLTVALGTEIVPALMLVAPLVTLGWIAAQNIGRGVVRTTLRRGATIAGVAVPASSPEAVTMAAAGYIGTIAAAIVPPEAIGWVLDLPAWGRFAAVAALPVLTLAMAQLALTPIVITVFVATAFSELGTLPADQHIMILAMSAGWSLALTASPFTAGPLILRRVTGLPGGALTWGWNGLYSLLAYAALVAFMAVQSLG